MSRKPIPDIMKNLRFDFNLTRTKRVEIDKFIMLLGMWNKFIENCVTSYKPRRNLALNKQLFPSKAKYMLYIMSNKPDKFCIKFRILVYVN